MERDRRGDILQDSYHWRPGGQAWRAGLEGKPSGAGCAVQRPLEITDVTKPAVLFEMLPT